MTIDLDQTRRIAELASLELDDDELVRLTAEIDEILNYVQQLQELDLDEVAPTAHVHLERLPLRLDEPGGSLERERALSQAPRRQDGAFAVPGFVDEG
jgi:aspartyl-tRNA(Asn)/glutamyl-tRNA(Gln) amidotransferase subunit C